VRLTLVNQFYAPDISPTAQLAASLAEHRADRGDEVTVITGRAGYLEGLAHTAPPEHHEVTVHRVWTPDLGKATLARRLTGYATFLIGSILRLLRLPRQDVVVAMTTPPLVVVGAVLHKLRHPTTRVVLWSMDCYPDAAERFGELRAGGPLSRTLRRVNRRLFRRLDDVVALDGAMATLLAQYTTEGSAPRFHVIPNWERASLFPASTGTRPWAGYGDLDLRGRPVVLYLGNTGVGHRFDTVLDAAAKLEDDAVFLFMGGGARWDDLVAETERRGLTNVRFHGYVPKDDTPAVMAGAAGALITLDDRSLGVMSPSKLHANLAAGLPILYVGPQGSNVDEAIEATGCGWSLRHGDVDALVEAVRALPGSDEVRQRAREAFETRYVDTATLPRFDTLLT
jgi:glycosyltransferase involved in cell wall biosynthesis